MDNHIVQYFHCKQCLDELPEDISPKDYARFEVGWTQHGFQVRCVRHDMNVIHIDFMGQKVTYFKEKE